MLDFFIETARIASLHPPMIEAWLLMSEALMAKEYPDFSISHPTKPVNNHVVLVSGGQDSTVAHRLASQHVAAEGGEVVGVYADFGQSYAESEMAALERVGIDYQKVSVATPFYEQRHESWNHIMPARNLLALCKAAEIGGSNATIWFGVVAGEMPETGGDKSKRFIQLAQGFLLKAFGTKEIKTLTVKTKADWARVWFLTQPDRDTLLKTVTCYNYDRKHCGTCQGCLRRYVALSLAGYDLVAILDTYHRHPLQHATVAIDKYKRFMAAELGIQQGTSYGYRRCVQTLTIIAPELLQELNLPLWQWEGDEYV